eukprot:1156864-Pelagomonas_calceolata.AAC.2
MSVPSVTIWTLASPFPPGGGGSFWAPPPKHAMLQRGRWTTSKHIECTFALPLLGSAAKRPAKKKEGGTERTRRGYVSLSSQVPLPTAAAIESKQNHHHHAFTRTGYKLPYQLRVQEEADRMLVEEVQQVGLACGAGTWVIGKERQGKGYIAVPA